MSVNYSLGAGKPLISREQNYVLDRKLLTVHSEDRDFSKWPNANEFEIVLPQQLLNVQSMRLVEIETPFTNQFNFFSTLNQNTKFSASYNGGAITELTIPSGTIASYSATNFATLITAINDQLKTLVGNNGGDFNITFNATTGLFQFRSTINPFTLNFNKAPLYCQETGLGSYQPTDNNIFGNTVNWGLPYNLGFTSKTLITATAGQTKTATSTPNITPDTCMYMEIDKYNSYDELYTSNQSNFDHSSSSNTRLVNANNSYAGKVNSAFAKIPLVTASAANVVFESRNIGLQNITHYDPPIERIPRLKFKLRYHDGRLVDFGNNQFNFTIEFNMLRNEMGKQLNVRIPSTYAL
jgi:hypothetical protein